MSLWADLSTQAKIVVVAFGVGIAGIGDTLSGLHVIGTTLEYANPFVTKWNLRNELDGRKLARDRTLAEAQQKTQEQIDGLSQKLDAIDERSLRWRVDDYPGKIVAAQAYLITLQTSLNDTLSPDLRRNILQQIQQAQDQIDALKRQQAFDSCVLDNLSAFKPRACP